MFLSRDDLKLAYGVDLEIGGFFVDRKKPENNAYWRKRHLYIIPQPGYIFIPVYTDLAYRVGLSKAELLSEKYLLLMEAVMDSAARQEIENTSMEAHISECIHVAEKTSENPEFLRALTAYFNGDKNTGLPFGSPYPSLSRADAYLFSLCAIPFDQQTAEGLVRAWNALMTFFLVKDDLVDIKDDLKNSQGNSIVEAGLDENGAEKIGALLDRSYDDMSAINPVLANRIDHTRATTDIGKIIQDILNQPVK